MGATAILCPTGRWALVGRAPVRAAYERKDGQPLTADDIDAIRHAGPGFAPVKARTYATEEEALRAAAEEIGQ